MTMDEVTTERAAQTSVGMLLRQARESRSMSVESVGAAIKLSPRQVLAIEADAYDRLLNPTYARGFIRNYASLLGLDPQSLLAQLDVQHITPSPQLIERRGTGVAMPMQSPRRRWLLPLLALSVPVIASAGLYAWFEYWPQAAPSSDLSAAAAPEQTPDAMPPLSDAPAEGADLAAPDAALPQDNTATGAPEAAVAGATQSQAAASAPVQTPAAGQHRLSFTFSQDSWVEIRDAQDRILMSELNRGGSSRHIDVGYPVSMVVGNARSVTLDVDGAPHDLAPSTKVDVARLRLE